MPHAIFAPSKSATWLECTWSARNSVPEPPKPIKTTQAASEGNRVHVLFDAAVSQMEFPEDSDPAANSIALGLDFVHQLEPGVLRTELEVTISDECWGTADLFNKFSPVATVLDVKNGKWDVDAYHNKQMLTYSAALLPYCDAEWWRLVIFQPNGLDETPFKQWVAHRSEVEAHRARVMRALSDRSPPRPGPWCRWCPAFQQCPAMAQDANFVVGAMVRRPEDLTTEELVRLLRLIRALGDVKSVYEDALTAHLRMGRTADGAVLKPQRTYRTWNDPIQAAQYLHSQYGAKGIKPLSPKQAEGLGLAGKTYAAAGTHKPEGQLKAVY